MSTAPVQSPIALQLREAEFQDDAVPLEFVGHWDKVGGCAEMINTGSSAMITFPNRNKKPYIIGGPLKDKYIFEQIHFHWVRSRQTSDELIFDDKLTYLSLPLLCLSREIAMTSDASICSTEILTAWRDIWFIIIPSTKTFRKRLISRTD